MLAQFSIFPVGDKESLSGDVAKVIDIVDKSGLSYRLTAMSTIVEGDWDEVLALIKKCHETMRQSNSRVHTSIIIDDRENGRNRLESKVEKIEKDLNRKLKT